MKKIEWIDYCKGVLMCLIVLGHIIPMISEVPTSLYTFRSWFCGFHVPAFFVVNGILKNRTSYLSRELTITSIVKKQSKIIKYYIAFSVIYLVIYGARCTMGMGDINMLSTQVCDVLTLNGVGVLWFLPVLLLSDLLFYFCFSKARLWRYLYIILLLCSLLIITFGFASMFENNNILLNGIVQVILRTFVGSSFVLLGYLLDKYHFWNQVYLYLVPLSALFFLNESTDTHSLTLNNVPLFYLFAISGCCVIILLSKILANYHQMKFINRYWGGYSLFIMCTHTGLYFAQIFTGVFDRLGFAPIVNALLSITCVMCLETLILIGYEKYKNNTRNRGQRAAWQ